ncbi:hypothetical protein SLE2022_323670 [Rubroshorea leprosula]
MASKRQLVSSSDSSDSDQESSRETSDSSESTEKQKPAEERHPDEEDSGSKDAGNGKRKSEEKSVSEDAPHHAEKQRSVEQCHQVNPESHSDAGKKTPLMINSSEDEKDSAATDSDASTPLKKSSLRASRKHPLKSESDQRRSRPKRVKKEFNEENAMKLFQRLWTEEDEIVILNGMIGYKDEMGEDPSSDMGEFYHYILESISFVCTKIQLKEKIRRLKDKYLQKANKGEKAFSTPHEDQVFRLSKKIWGKQKVKKATEVHEEVNVNIPIRKSLGVANLEAKILAVGLDVVGGPEKEALEKRWKSLRIAELKAFLVRNQIVADQAKLLLDYYKTH